MNIIKFENNVEIEKFKCKKRKNWTMSRFRTENCIHI